jgi:hypothetical protein
MNKVYQIITSVKLDPASKAYKKAIAKSQGMLTGSPDIYQTTGKFVDKIEDKPEQGKIYSLFGGKGEACIAAGNTWAESEVEPERPKSIVPLGG